MVHTAVVWREEQPGKRAITVWHAQIAVNTVRTNAGEPKRVDGGVFIRRKRQSFEGRRRRILRKFLIDRVPVRVEVDRTRSFSRSFAHGYSLSDRRLGVARRRRWRQVLRQESLDF